MMRFLRHSYTAIILGFLYLPIFILIVFSFNASKSRAVWEGFTLRWYEELLESEAILDALSYTLSVAVISSLVATVIGTLAAFAIYREMRPFERKLSMNLTYVPLLNPDIVTGISLMLLFRAIGFSTGARTVLIAHITFNIPYVMLSVLPRFIA